MQPKFDEHIKKHAFQLELLAYLKQAEISAKQGKYANVDNCLYVADFIIQQFMKDQIIGEMAMIR